MFLNLFCCRSLSPCRLVFSVRDSRLCVCVYESDMQVKETAHYPKWGYVMLNTDLVLDSHKMLIYFHWFYRFDIVASIFFLTLFAFIFVKIETFLGGEGQFLILYFVFFYFWNWVLYNYEFFFLNRACFRFLSTVFKFSL